MRSDRFYQLVKLHHLVRSHRLKFAGLLGVHFLRRRHLVLRFDPVMACNLRCQMCYFSDPNFMREHKGRFGAAEVERIAEVFFPWTLQLYLGCGTEPTTYKGFIDIVALGKKHGVPMVGMVSNGQLLTRQHLAQLVDLGLDELTLSTHGVERESYERLMTRASFDRFLEVLDDLEAVKKQRGSTRPQLRLNYTVNPENLEELRNFFGVYGKYSIRTLQVRPIIDFKDTEYKNKDMSPYVERYHVILDSIAQECRERAIRLLANLDDATYEKKSPRAALAEELLIYLSPEKISKPDFDWRHESYREYRSRTGWSKTLLRHIFTPAATFERTGPRLSWTVLG